MVQVGKKIFIKIKKRTQREKNEAINTSGHRSMALQIETGARDKEMLWEMDGWRYKVIR